MKVLVEKNYEAISKTAGRIFIESIASKPDIVLGLATGSTPIGMYKEMIRAYEEEGLDFSKVKTFNLDEYVGLSQEHPSSYAYFMDNELFKYININKENTHVPDGKAENIEEYCKRYDEMINEAGGIDIQVLGIGENGHIAFNEPDEALSAGTSVVKLTENTIEVNSRFFDSLEEVPKTAITMGMGSILRARKIILLASGEKKAPVIKRLLNDNKVTTMFPVSFLLLHPDVTIIVDEEAYNG
ncbi:glucosamine-6-phosphate deaminase [Tissierella carlieri]|uniref:Glucosamine-6-phosphate deaminase n=1 Tax=Tissierella carlieri TaxID=689904 RepID=A0ABT1S8C8_9FIRM|nr:glucosamine-6-phosphate deaminase [Tissierella carlieri]MCQ4922721.1 glucosamine-6-phosphate deaminase [Tissierella carlieri]